MNRPLPTEEQITARARRELVAYNGSTGDVLVCPACAARVPRVAVNIDEHADRCEGLRDLVYEALR